MHFRMNTCSDVWEFLISYHKSFSCYVMTYTFHNPYVMTFFKKNITSGTRNGADSRGRGETCHDRFWRVICRDVNIISTFLVIFVVVTSMNVCVYVCVCVCMCTYGTGGSLGGKWRQLYIGIRYCLKSWAKLQISPRKCQFSSSLSFARTVYVSL